MSFEIEDDHTAYDQITKEIQELDNLSLEIGVFGSDDSFYAMIAGVHEFGMSIKAKGKFLVIPLSAKYKDVDPKSLDLFFMRTKEGHNFLCRNVGKGKIEFCYMLAKQVNIPERSFIRSTFDENLDSWVAFFAKRIEKICQAEMTAKQAYDQLGARIVGDVQKKMRNLRTPPLSGVTIAGRKRHSSNPLVDTGQLRQHVTWRVVRSDAND